MKLLLDKYAYLDSPIHRWQPKPKLIGLITLIFAFAFVQKLIFIGPMIVVTAIIYLLSRLPFSFLLERLRYPGLFISAVVILLPFIAGKTVIFSWGILTVKKEGLWLMLLIVTRFVCILTISLVLFGTAPFLTTLKTMRSLGLSQIIADMMLLSYRYLEELGETLITMQRALRLKGFELNKISRRNLQVIASLTGSLLVRSYQQSKVVYQAMILRGYGYQKTPQLGSPESISYQDWLFCGLMVLFSLTWICLQFWLLSE